MIFLELLGIQEDIQLFNLWAEASPSFAAKIKDGFVNRKYTLRDKLRVVLLESAVDNLIDAAPLDKRLELTLLIKNITIDNSTTAAYAVTGCSSEVKTLLENFIKNPAEIENVYLAILDSVKTKTNWRVIYEKDRKA